MKTKSQGYIDIGVSFAEAFAENPANLKKLEELAEKGGVDVVGVPAKAPYAQDAVPSSRVLMIERLADKNSLLDINIDSKVRLVWSSFAATGLLRRALQFANGYDLRVMFMFEGDGLNESLTGYELGYGSEFYSRETSEIARISEVARDVGAKIHFSKVSSSRSITLIERAKNDGVDVTSDVSIGHLLYSEQTLFENHELKLSPVLRSEEDRQALIEAVKNQTIDCISSGHKYLKRAETETDFLSRKPGSTRLGEFSKDLETLGLKNDILQHACVMRPRELMFDSRDID